MSRPVPGSPHVAILLGTYLSGFYLEVLRIPTGVGVRGATHRPCWSSPQEEPAASPEGETLLQGARTAASMDLHRPAMYW